MTYFAKILNGGLVLAPSPIKTENSDIFTNDPAVYKAHGYKPVSFTDYPADGRYYICEWSESENEIIQTWMEAERPADPQTLLNIITGG